MAKRCPWFGEGWRRTRAIPSAGSGMPPIAGRDGSLSALVFDVNNDSKPDRMHAHALLGVMSGKKTSSQEGA